MNGDPGGARRQLEREELADSCVSAAERTDEPVLRTHWTIGQSDRGVTAVAGEGSVEAVRSREATFEVVRSGDRSDPVGLGAARVTDAAKGHGGSLVVGLASARGMTTARTLGRMAFLRFWRGRAAKEVAVSIGDPRFDGWETVNVFEDQRTAVAWRDQLRAMGVDGHCVADHPLDRTGRGEIYLVVPPDQWSRANEISENLD